jgi:hypothetical protein
MRPASTATFEVADRAYADAGPRRQLFLRQLDSEPAGTQPGAEIGTSVPHHRKLSNKDISVQYYTVTGIRNSTNDVAGAGKKHHSPFCNNILFLFLL